MSFTSTLPCLRTIADCKAGHTTAKWFTQFRRRQLDRTAQFLRSGRSWPPLHTTRLLRRLQAQRTTTACTCLPTLDAANKQRHRYQPASTVPRAQAQQTAAACRTAIKRPAVDATPPIGPVRVACVRACVRTAYKYNRSLTPSPALSARTRVPPRFLFSVQIVPHAFSAQRTHADLRTRDESWHASML